MTSPTTDRRQGLVGNTPFKAPVDCATTANIVLSGEQVIDGYQTASSRVLVYNQTVATQNGLYDSSTAAWTRCADADGNYDLVQGSFVYVRNGATNGGGTFQVSTAGTITIGSTLLNWAKGLFSSSSLLGFLAAGIGAVLRSMQDKGRDFVTTLDYGAKHDGVTDDTTAVQKAINACILSGKELRIPAGNVLHSALTITGSIKIRGEGPNTVLKQSVVIGNTFSVTGNGSTVDIADLTFDGQQSLQGALSTNDAINATATGLASGRPFHLIVNNCDFLNTPYRGIAMYGANDPTKRQVGRITGNRFRNGSINDTNTVYSAIDVHLVNSVEAIVDDNDFTFDAAPNLTGGAGRGGVIVAQTQTATAYYSRVTITNNRFNYRGVNELASLGAVDCYIWTGNATVANNVFTNSTAAPIKFKGNSYNFSAVNNKIDGYYGTNGAIPNFAAISFNSPNYGTCSSQFIIEGNQITNWNPGAGTGFISVSCYDGVSTFSKNVSVLNNQISGVTGAAVGIDVNNCQDVTVSGNEIDGAGNISLGIRVLACDGSIRITNNKISGTTSYSIYNDTPLTAAQDVLIAGNVILANSGTYSIYTHCRQVNVRNNWMSGGVHGVNFGGGVRSALCDGNVLTNMTGTVGFNVTSTIVNMLARGNAILDSTGIVANAFVLGQTPSGTLINSGNTWNGQVTQGTVPPTSGVWAVGDYCRNTAPTTGGNSGWYVTSTTAGSSGQWTGQALP